MEQLYKQEFTEEKSLLSYNTHYPIYVTSDLQSNLLAWVAPIKNTNVYDVLINLNIYIDIFIQYDREIQSSIL